VHVDILFHDLSFLLAHKLSILKLKIICASKEDCMIVLTTCIFVCILQLLCLLHNLASQKPVLRGNASRTSKPLAKPLPFVSTITTYYVVFPATPSKYFMCYL